MRGEMNKRRKRMSKVMKGKEMVIDLEMLVT
jgi:hypothetical protein